MFSLFLRALPPDDWCIPRRYVYRILHFVGPELWGSVWPGPPRGWVGALPGRSARPVRRVPVGVVVEGGAAAPAAAAAGAGTGCAQCGSTAGKLMACTRCRAASYCSGKCQKLHYPAHKVGCRAAAAAAGVAGRGAAEGSVGESARSQRVTGSGSEK